jgi:hypothetical protein
MKTENPIEEIWRIRDELAAEEGNDPVKVFEILRREEKKYGTRVRHLAKASAEPPVVREASPGYAVSTKHKKRSSRE